MPNNQSLDRVRAKLDELMFVSCPTEEKEPFFWRWTDEGIENIAYLINSELQNLRQELVSEIEGLKLKHNGNILTTPKYNATEEERKTGNNQAIDKVLAIIKEKK